jgi:hypothetical protein
MGWYVLDGQAHDRKQCKALVKAVMNFRDQYNSGNLWNGCTTGRLSQLHGVRF